MVRGPAGSATSLLLEREPELARIDQLIAATTAGAGHVVVFEGRPGIGKTALLTELRIRAQAAGMAAYSARASELEGEFAFGVVRQLFEPVVRSLSQEESSRLLAGAAALAAPVLGLEGERVTGGPFAALHGLYWLAADLSARGPLLLAVDDAHWADLPSLHWLAFLLRRLEGLPILLAVTTRPVRPGPQGEVLASLMAESGVELMQVGSLGERSIAALVEGAFGTVPDARFTAACQRATAGNPLALRAVIGDLVAQGVRPTAAAAATLEQQVPVALARWTLSGLARLGDPALRFARALAVIGDGAEVRRVGRLAGLPPEDASEAADRLSAADLLVAERPPRFAHPLLRAAVYDDIPLGVRSRLHQRAAELLGADGANAEAVAAHLLRSEPGEAPETVERLRAAAQAAIRRGAPQAAIAYLQKALTETAAGPTRVTVLSDLGWAELLAGDLSAAAAHLQAAVATCTDPVTRGHIRNELADAVRAQGNRGLSLQIRLQALEDLGNRDPDASERIRVRISVPLLTTLHHPGPGPDPIDYLRGVAAGGGALAKQAHLALGWLLAIRGEPCEPVWSHIDRGLDGGSFLAEETSDSPAAFWAAFTLVYTDQLTWASAFASEIQADATARGSTIGLGVGSMASAVADLRRGRLSDAEASFGTLLEIAQPQSLLWPLGAALLAETLVELGRTDAARARIEDVRLPEGIVGDFRQAFLLGIRGRVLCRLGRTDEGIADLRHCGELAEDLRMLSPTFLQWRSELATRLAGRSSEEAKHHVEAEVKLARRAGIPSAIGSVLRTSAAIGPAPEAVELLAEAAAVLESSPVMLTRARVMLDLGAALRRQGRQVEAREPLRQALEIATACGAVPLADQAREEAILAGARPRRPRLLGLDALTPAELRTARLAGEGRTNREIAQALFITVKTVSDHLGAAYSKLGISTRADLAEALARTGR